MTHTQTQGADGAGTLTAGLTFDELQRAHAAGIRASNWRLFSQPVSIEILENYLPAAVAAIRPAPAATPAVPDSLRRAFATFDADPGSNALYWHCHHLAYGFVRSLLAAQPAATPGVPDSLREAFAAATDSPVFVHDFADPAVSSAPGCQDVSLSFVTPDHITAAFMGNGLAGTIDQARKDAVALAAAWNHVRALIAAQPAGQAGDAGAETERLREAVSKALHDNQFLDDWREMVDPVVDAALAARPEAPSDAGWSFDMEAAPRDGTPINVGRDNGCGWDLLVVWWSKSATEYPWHTEGGGEYPEHRFDCWATLTPPSDPAPSGQAEG